MPKQIVKKKSITNITGLCINPHNAPVVLKQKDADLWICEGCNSSNNQVEYKCFNCKKLNPNALVKNDFIIRKEQLQNSKKEEITNSAVNQKKIERKPSEKKLDLDTKCICQNNPSIGGICKLCKKQRIKRDSTPDFKDEDKKGNILQESNFTFGGNVRKRYFILLSSKSPLNRNPNSTLNNNFNVINATKPTIQSKPSNSSTLKNISKTSTMNVGCQGTNSQTGTNLIQTNSKIFSSTTKKIQGNLSLTVKKKI